jgi:23S rRNA (adenine2503-C2)-methyltransferase
MKRIDLKALSKAELDAFVKEQGLPRFRAQQLMHWMYERRAQSIAGITELSKSLRDDLAKKAVISNLEIRERLISTDGTEKFLFGLADGETIESVLIPGDDRITLCISSQVGCAMGCRCCLTARLGIRRDLEAHEIVDQVITVERAIAPRIITNIVLMGMGEPLANFDNVVEALHRMTGMMKITPRRITLSTSGVVPGIVALGETGPKVNLAVSLNATTDGVRDGIMPINKRWPLKALLDACRAFPLAPHRRITFEYVLLKGINDTPADAKRLVRLLHTIPSKVNLIPFNPFEGSGFERPGDERVLAFQDVLAGANVTALIRKSKGQDILAACGQLQATYRPGVSVSRKPGSGKG